MSDVDSYYSLNDEQHQYGYFYRSNSSCEYFSSLFFLCAVYGERSRNYEVTHDDLSINEKNDCDGEWTPIIIVHTKHYLLNSV